VACKATEHFTGRAIDFNLGAGPFKANIEKIQATDAFRLMTENASYHGFNPYPVEPWHWSYNFK